ncbi:MAG: SgcJ/EcaC family oxidoreductase [Acidobacteria bacterium]|nr:SgcJ/EcaC family oxidoreductase [Acidobacteriota bacterium]
MVSLRYCAVLSLLILVAGCTTTAPDPVDARAAIERNAAAWGDAVNRGDLDTLVDLYTQDALLMPPGSESLRGRTGVRQFAQGFSTYSPRDVALTVEEVEVCGDTAYEVGSYSMSLQPPGQNRFTDRGKYIVVWKRGADGMWRIHRDIFNSNTPPTT